MEVQSPARPELFACIPEGASPSREEQVELSIIMLTKKLIAPLVVIDDYKFVYPVENGWCVNRVASDGDTGFYDPEELPMSKCLGAVRLFVNHEAFDHYVDHVPPEQMDQASAMWRQETEATRAEWRLSALRVFFPNQGEHYNTFADWLEMKNNLAIRDFAWKISDLQGVRPPRVTTPSMAVYFANKLAQEIFDGEYKPSLPRGADDWDKCDPMTRQECIRASIGMLMENPEALVDYQASPSRNVIRTTYQQER